VVVDRRLASWWFTMSLRPDGWALPPVWDPIAGDYAAADGWIRLHTNAPHHRAAAATVLGDATDRAAVAAAVAHWSAGDLEAAVVAAGGCAAAMRDADAWRAHPQGAAVATEPLIAWAAGTRATAADAGTGASAGAAAPADRPLAGVRVLDLTRVLAGPIATRFLAGYGADVLRLDPPWWEEPSVVPEVTLGKRCARVDLRSADGRATVERLLAQADVLVHGYRGDALDRLGLGADERQALRPGLVDVSLDAYGWTGPWRHRRGFDSLVQMSCGIAAAGMRRAGRDVPTPLPAQALDHATGYLLAAAAIRGLRTRAAQDRGSIARCSLARTAHLLVDGPAGSLADELAPPTDGDLDVAREATPWGPARRLRPPLDVIGAPYRWDRPAAALGSSPAAW
jgi:hypothetical protein